MSHVKTYAALGGLILIATIALVKRGPGKSLVPSADLALESGSIHSASSTKAGSVKTGSVEAAKGAGVSLQMKVADANALGASLTAGPIANKERKPREFRYQRELDDFTFLRKKIFLSDTEKAEQKNLLRDPKLIRSMGELLKTPGGNDFESQAETSMALNFLFQALQNSSSDVAAGVLKNIIQDGSVENASMDLDSRKELAGVKAEVLYQWSALQPSVAGQMQSWLPGPVSQTLWKNVVALQQSNLAESRLEIAAGRAGSATH